MAALSIIYTTWLYKVSSALIAVRHLQQQCHRLPPLYITMLPSSAAVPPPSRHHCPPLLYTATDYLLSPNGTVVCSRLPSHHPPLPPSSNAIVDHCHQGGSGLRRVENLGGEDAPVSIVNCIQSTYKGFPYKKFRDGAELKVGTAKERPIDPMQVQHIS